MFDVEIGTKGLEFVVIKQKMLVVVEVQPLDLLLVVSDL